MLFGSDSLFSCTSDGVNNVIIKQVKELHGEVADKPYQVWMDDGEGGPPATIRTLGHQYTRDQCQQLLDRRIAELKAW